MDFQFEVDEADQASPVVELPGTSSRHPDRRFEPSGPEVVRIDLRSMPAWEARRFLGLQRPEELRELLQALGFAEENGRLSLDVVDRLREEINRRARVRAGMR